MRLFIPLILLLFARPCLAQVSAVQQKSLNSCVDYANQSAKEVASVVQAITEYYGSLQRRNKVYGPRFSCPVQPDEYYYNKAIEETKKLANAAVTEKLKGLRQAAEKIDAVCKQIDTYHKLEDYKQDNFAKAQSLVVELTGLLPPYQKSQYALQAELEALYKKLAGTAENAYRKADRLMRQEIVKERSLLDAWSFNLQQDVHTGWPVDMVQKSIPETDERVSSLKATAITLHYPASSMWTSFQGSLGSVLQEKRRAIDEYNFEAKKSDKHSNDVYLGLINYFNGTMVSDYNTFISFSERDNYHGLKMIQYVPIISIRTQGVSTNVTVKPFEDKARVAPVMNAQKTAIGKPVYMALTNYIDYINETWRQVRYMHMVLRSFNSSAAYYRSLDSFEKRAGLNFDYKDYQVPLSYYQKAVADSKALPPQVAATLNTQAEVLLNILKEMDDIAAAMETEVKEKKYESDHLDKIYVYLERQRVLIETWDARKEQMYADVRQVYEAFPPASPSNAWQVSGLALKKLTDLDRAELFKAKSFYRGDSSILIQTAAIDETLRDVIAREYDNMKGIEKYGRYNGLCPYTPYEDLPQTSRTLSEKLVKLKPVKADNYRHPYEDLVYLYNDIVEDHNKFCELSKDVPLLKTVFQPELFIVKYPGPKQTNQQPVVSRDQTTQATQTSTTTEQKVATKPSGDVQKNTSKVVHDTVYIEKRDTVYLTEPGENLRSMEGYATNNMVLLLDVSGSMNTPGKLPLLKESVLNILSMMRQEDEVSIVVFSGKSKVLLPPASFKDESKIKKAIEGLTSSGKTDGNAGLKLAYKVADENYIRGGNNRIILATDGEFAVSDETLAIIEKFAGQDIFLTIFNFGQGMGSGKALEKLAQTGRGNYERVSQENVEMKLIREAKGKKKK